MEKQINIESLSVGYDDKLIIKNMDLGIKKGVITTIAGPNGCGKSTLLKSIGRILKPNSGKISIEGRDIHKTNTKELAKKLSFLPQVSSEPDELTVFELVSYGRTPHLKGFGRLTDEDYEKINFAMKITEIDEFADRPIGTLSGGQKQRVRIATVLAQDTDIIFLDEPTTYLDLSHQLEILLILKKLNREYGKTIVVVLHDINLASRFSDELIMLRHGELIAQGSPIKIMNSENLKKVFDISAKIQIDQESKIPIITTYNLLNKSI